MTSKTVGAPGAVKLVIKAKGKQAKKLKRKGKVKLKAKITYTPTGGDARTRTLKLKTGHNERACVERLSTRELATVYEGSMSRLPTPEEALRDRDGPPLLLSLSCTMCGAVSKERFDWACVHPDLEACRAQGWDGVSLSRMVCCAKCGAIDAYKLVGKSYLMLTGTMLASALGRNGGRAFVAESRLWDGTQVRRPSQALAHLRELAARHNSVEAHTRLGNGCERFGLIEEALTAWRRAVEIDKDALEPLGSLAERLFRAQATQREGFSFLLHAVQAIPKPSSMDRDTRHAFVRRIFEVLRELPEEGEPIALMAGWRGGASTAKQPIVHMSSVDLRDVLKVWDRLVDFAASPPVLSLALSNELPEDPEPQLLHLLLEGEEARVPARQAPMIAAPKTSRNDPCPCGSGKKYKRCCADASTTK